MKLWISKFFLLAAGILLLFHNIVAHHHDHDEDGNRPAREAAHREPFSALSHVQIDHHFCQDAVPSFHFDAAWVAVVPDGPLLPEPAWMALPQTSWLIPEKPHPPGGCIDQCILRGPPSAVNAAV